jgi:hypothetical protein
MRKSRIAIFSIFDQIKGTMLLNRKRSDKEAWGKTKDANYYL